MESNDNKEKLDKKNREDGMLKEFDYFLMSYI